MNTGKVVDVLGIWHHDISRLIILYSITYLVHKYDIRDRKMIESNRTEDWRTPIC